MVLKLTQPKDPGGRCERPRGMTSNHCEVPAMSNRTCEIADCGKPVHVRKYGWCNAHYQKWRKYGDPSGCVVPQYNLPCAFPGCDAQRRYDQLCMGHYNQQRQGRRLGPLRRLTDPTARDASGRKQCRRCEHWLPEDSFSVNRARRDGLTAYCRRCERDKALIHNYGISISRYEEMLAQQNGGCAICGGVNKSGRPLAVDHDHGCCPAQRTCGACVRGLLCSECNLGIGYFDDDLTRMETAMAYLRTCRPVLNGGAR